MRLLVLFGLTLSAHDLGVTGVQLRIADGRTHVRVQAHVNQLQGKDAGTELAKRLRLRLDGSYFETQGKVLPATEIGIVAWEASRDGVPASIIVDAPLFPEDEAAIAAYLNANRLDAGRTQVPATAALQQFDQLLGNLGQMGGTNRRTMHDARRRLRHWRSSARATLRCSSSMTISSSRGSAAPPGCTSAPATATPGSRAAGSDRRR